MRTARFTAARYARALASTTSVATPRPVTRRPSTSICTTTSPKASVPPVTLDTWKLTSRPSTPAARWIAPIAASIRPSPIADSLDHLLTTPEPHGRAAARRWVPPSDLAATPCTSTSSSVAPSSSADDRREVLVGELHLAVGEVLEPRERAVQVVVVERDADLVERVDERVATRVLAEYERVALEPDLDRVHDLVGRAVAEHAVLVDAALVRERARAHDRLVRLHGVAGGHRDQPRGPRDLLDVEAVRAGRAPGPRVRTIIAISSSEQLPARSPMPLTATSTCPAPFSMPASEFATASPRSLWQCVEITTWSGVSLAHDADQLAELRRRGVPDRVGHVDRRGAALYREPEALEQELERGSGRVLRARTRRRRCSSSRASRSRGSRPAPAGSSSSASTRAARRSWR